MSDNVRSVKFPWGKRLRLVRHREQGLPDHLRDSVARLGAMELDALTTELCVLNIRPR